MQIKTDDCGGQVGERSTSRKKGRRERGRKEEEGNLRIEQKDGTARRIELQRK